MTEWVSGREREFVATGEARGGGAGWGGGGSDGHVAVLRRG